MSQKEVNDFINDVFKSKETFQANYLPYLEAVKANNEFSLH